MTDSPREPKPVSADEYRRAKRHAKYYADDKCGMPVGVINLARCYLDKCAEAEKLRDGLADAENTLADYIPTLEAKGASLNYGRMVLAKIRALLSNPGASHD